jgi:hypothetical protein
MKQFKSFLIEKRKNHEQNQKEGIIDYLKLHKDELTSGRYFISFVYHPKLGLNPINKYDTPTGVYSYPLAYFYKAIVSYNTFSFIPYQNKAPYIYLFKANEVNGKRIISHGNYDEATFEKDFDILVQYLNKTIDLSKYNTSTYDNGELKNKIAYLSNVKNKLNKEHNSILSLINKVAALIKKSRYTKDINPFKDNAVSDAIQVLKTQLAELEALPENKRASKQVQRDINIINSLQKQLNFLNIQHNKFNKKDKLERLDNLIFRVSNQIEKLKEKEKTTDRMVKTHGIFVSSVDDNETNENIAMKKMEAFKTAADLDIKKKGINRKRFDIMIARLWFITFKLSEFISGVKKELQVNIWNDIFYNVLNIGGVIDNGAKFIHEAEPNQAVFFSKDMFSNVMLFKNTIYNIKKETPKVFYLGLSSTLDEVKEFLKDRLYSFFNDVDFLKELLDSSVKSLKNYFDNSVRHLTFAGKEETLKEIESRKEAIIGKNAWFVSMLRSNTQSANQFISKYGKDYYFKTIDDMVSDTIRRIENRHREFVKKY